ncbi:probable E3 ubiquitin-protein ligase HERC6 [Haplochromis burtoni]|uniref:probable E3 ubiquitin-protein ligase HERC6 n=1 Tax=Haplochromis burtoni TaxID=8153 RepID=UPI001C2DB4A5|nr:probable E3 ubiquitin-protein ligase HERC6 [Haplochromis burtoni]
MSFEGVCGCLQHIVENVFQEFKRGFFLVCEQDLVKLFRPKELQEVMVGKDFSDWEKLNSVEPDLQGFKLDSETRRGCFSLFRFTLIL